MAKLKAPLLSLGAAGQIGKTIVFFPWKGINAAREYVVPANPKTTPQNDQRGYVRTAVAAVHTAEASPTNPLDEEDKTAWSLMATVQGMIMTWFNAMVKVIVDQLVAGDDWSIFGDMHCTPGATKLTVAGFLLANGTAPATNGALYYGTSKTALLGSVACTVAALNGGKDITGLTTGVKYYVQYRPSTPSNQVGSNSGIYSGIAA